MSSHATAGRDVTERKLFVVTKLTEQLVDHLERLELDVGQDPALRGQVDDLQMLALVLLDELKEIELY